MTFRDRPFAVWGLPLVTLLIALTILGTDVAGLASLLRGSLFDAFTRAAPRPYEEVSGHPVRVVDIDPDTAQAFGAWPWPHRELARLTAAIAQHGAAVIVYAGHIDRADPLSPQNLLPQIPKGPEFDAVRRTITTLPSADSALATALSATKTVLGFDLGSQGPLPAVKSEIRWNGTRDPFFAVPAFKSAAGSLPLFEAAAAGLGAGNLMPDKDGKVRRTALVYKLHGKAVPSLPAEVLRIVSGKPSLRLKSDDGNSGFFGGIPGVMQVETANGPLATAPDGSIWLALSGYHQRRMVPASAVLDNTLKADALRGAIVFIGNPAQTAATATGPRSLAEIDAEATENLLLGTVLRRPIAAGQAELLCLVLIGIGCALIIARFGVRIAALYCAAVTGVIAYGAWRLFISDHVLFDALGLSAALWSVWLTGALVRTAAYWRTQWTLKWAFTDVLPPDVITFIARQPEPMKLQGETRVVTYLACGVRGFSELAASFRGDPSAFTHLIQRVLDPLMAEALAHGGAIDRMTADGFTAFWNAPIDDPEHGVHACEAAMDMTEAIAQINEIITHERRKDGAALDPVEIGIGVSSGQAIAGGFKIHGRTAYSVNGDCAVESCRIQQLSAGYGPAVIVSEETRKIAERGFAFLEVDYIALEASREPVKLFAMLGNPVMRASPKFRALATFHDHIFQSMRDQQWHKTKALIAQCRKLSGASQKLYDLHLSRIAYFETHPPGPGWDGAFRQILQ
jgi:Predicted transmembrane sensor domain